MKDTDEVKVLRGKVNLMQNCLLRIWSAYNPIERANEDNFICKAIRECMEACGRLDVRDGGRRKLTPLSALRRIWYTVRR